MASKLILPTLLRTTRTQAPFAQRSILRQPLLHARLYSTPSNLEPPSYLDSAELHVFNLIKNSLSPTKLEVQDISGGCGSMYGIDIVSEQFRGLSTIKQHRLVNKILGEEIKKWHGVQLKTKAPE